MTTQYTIHMNKQIGLGAFGSVQSVSVEKVNKLIPSTEEINNSMTYALKILSPKYKSKNLQTQQEEEKYMQNASYHSNLIRELCTMPKLEEGKMIQLYSPQVYSVWFSYGFDAAGVPEQNGQQKAFVLQRKFSMDCGHLFRHAVLNEADKSNFYRSVLKYLTQLHERGIAHRDLKPANILFHPYYYLFAVTDYGQTSLLEGISKQKVNVSTRDVRAPEFLLDANDQQQVSFAHGVEGDIWSFGMVVLCAELKKSSQPLTSMAHIKDDETHLLREIVRERFQGVFQPNDLAFGPDVLPLSIKARSVIARMLFPCKTVGDVEDGEKKIPFSCNLENIFVLQNSLRLHPLKRLSASDLASNLRLPIARKTPFTSNLYQHIPSIPEVPVQEKVAIPSQMLLDGTSYSQFPIPKYKVSVHDSLKRKSMLQHLVLILRCLTNTNVKYSMTEFLIQSIDIFDRLFSDVSVKRMKDMFYAATKKVSIPCLPTNFGIELNTQTTLFSVFNPDQLNRESFENFDCLILAIYIADQVLHYGSVTTLETLIKKFYTTVWKGFAAPFLACKDAKEEDVQTYFVNTYWTFLETKEKFLAHFVQESLASLNFSLVDDSLLFMLRKQKVMRCKYVVSRVLQVLELKPSYKVTPQDVEEFQAEFETQEKDVSLQLNWGWGNHTKAEYQKPFVVE